MWIAELSESSNLWTQMALLGSPGSMSVWASWQVKPRMHCYCSSVYGVEISCMHASHARVLKYSTVAKASDVTTSGNQHLQHPSSAAAIRKLPFPICLPLDCTFSVCLSLIEFEFWPQIRQDYPLNLSILISGGKETNKDSLSNGEWSGKSSKCKSV